MIIKPNLNQVNQLKETGETISAAQLVKLIEDKVYTLNSYSANGTFSTFDSTGACWYISTCQLNTNKYLVCFKNQSNSDYGTAMVLSVSGSTITAGNPFVFNSASTFDISVSQIDVDKAILVYTDNTDGYYGKSIALSVSGTTITAGSPFVFNSGSTSSPSVAKLDTNKAIVCYINISKDNRSIVLSIDGDTITAGSYFTFNTGINSNYNIEVDQLDINKAIVIYKDSSKTSRDATAQVLTISGTTISGGTEFVFDPNHTTATEYMYVAKLDTNKAIVIYADQINSKFGTAKLLTISGTTITAGSPTVIENVEIQFISAISLSNSKMLISYVLKTISDGKTSILDVNGTDITINSSFVFDKSLWLNTSLSKIDSDSAILSYNASGDGRAVIISKNNATGYALAQEFNSNLVSGRTDNKTVIPYTSLV